MRYSDFSRPPAQKNIQYRAPWNTMCGAQRWVSPHVGSVDSANGCFVHGPWRSGAVA